MKRKKIAIIGSGISGLTCAYYLSPNHEITVYEADEYIGGHTHTIDIDHDGEQIGIDTGFIVFNDRTYPNFIRLMEEIGVDYQPTEMSFSVRNDLIGLEYNGHSFMSLFAQKKNLVSSVFWRMLFEINRFNKDVKNTSRKSAELILGDYLHQKQFNQHFCDNYLLPMISAIWSMGVADVYRMPLHFLVRFFDNHGLLDLVNRPQWFTIKGGSSSYIAPLTAGFQQSIHLNHRVTGIRRTEQSVEIEVNNHQEQFDEVVLACHGDQALSLLTNPSSAEQEVLGKFEFTDNNVILHTDTSLMPRSSQAWASWNYRISEGSSIKPTLTYNMNILQRLKTKHTYLVSLNTDVRPEHVLGTYSYDHPAYTLKTLEAQNQWPLISGQNRLHFCGAYWFNGFHEDGVNSALRVCNDLEGMS
jgi:predicted NAD/FAD-binding protein